MPIPEDIGEGDNPQDDQPDINKNDGKLKKWLNHLAGRDPDRHIELFLALAITFFAGVQLYVTISNNKSTSDQVDKIITAADSIKASAGQIKDAGWVFSGAAYGINNAGWNAFGQLKLQEQQMEKARLSTEKIARQSLEEAQNTVYLEQRPWVAIQILPVDTSNFLRPINPTSQNQAAAYRIVFRNSGRTPALRTKEECFEITVKDRNQIVPSCDELRAARLADEKAKNEAEINEIVEKNVALEHRYFPNEDVDAIRSRERTKQEQLRGLENQYRFAEVPPPNEGVTIIPEGTYDDPSFAAEASPDGKFHYFVGKIVYSDPLRPIIEHETNYCLMRWDGLPWEFCNFGQGMN